MRIAVAGGTGVVGRHVVTAVRAAGHEPVVLARLTGVDVTTGELMTTVQEPVPPEVVQLDEPTNVAEAPFEFVSENEIIVPSGAFVGPAPLPVSTST